MPRRFVGRSLIGCLFLCGAVWADVKPHPLFSDHCVLQRARNIPIWGWADLDETVTVKLGGRQVDTIASGGKWKVEMPPMEAGGPHTLVISGKNTVEVKDVLIGEVWICSGQSNMQWSVKDSADPDSVISNSADKMLCLFTVPREADSKPRDTVKGAWAECGPASVKDFSAVAYHFGRTLRAKLQVPVGLINTSYGGTPAEAWTKREDLAAVPSLKYYNDAADQGWSQIAKLREQHQAKIAEWKKARDEAKKEGKEAPKRPGGIPGGAGYGAGLYNAMIAPLVPYSIRGAIWYQGESNAGRAVEYGTLFPTMISSWRKVWGQGDFPFLFVQLAPFMAIKPEPGDSAWAELRESQRLTLKASPNSGMAVITDVGEEKDIHPKKKGPVGERLAAAGLALAYGQKIEYSGPTLQGIKIEGEKAVVEFGHTEGGLVAKGESLTGFTIAGSDQKFHKATAEIVGNTVVVSSPEVKQPVAVRFGWADFPVVNFWNGAGFPASPFRTDDFPLKTATPRKK